MKKNLSPFAYACAAFFGLMSVAFLGCGTPLPMQSDSVSESAASPAVEYANEADFASAEKSSPNQTGTATSLPESLQDDGGQPVDRKIIYTANVSLIVTEFDGLNESIEKLVKQYGGIIASNNVNSSQDRQRYGSWRVRIPVNNFEDFFGDVQDLGVPTEASRDSEDVTEEYFDVEARIKSKKKLEERVLKLLERPDDKIQHVIEVERELARIRSEIERMEGRIRYLKDRISLTTITISAREERDYTPPQMPNLGNRISTTWGTSIESLQKFGANSLVWLVGATPWLILWGMLLAIAWLVFKGVSKIRRACAAAGQST